VQKRHCTLRAEWRLLRGHPAQPLSGHYRLDCDYGTPLITIYTNGDPVFLCGSHATAIGRPNDDCVVGVRLLEAQSADDSHPPEDNERQPMESSAAKNSASPAAERGLPAPKVRRDPGPSKKRPAPDLAYGDPSKALVDEAIWNLPAGDLDVFTAELLQGKPLTEAAQSAGGQFAIIHRKIAEYTLKIEAILSESKDTINVYNVIDAPFEAAMVEIISNVKLSEMEKDRAIDCLGAFQAQLKHGLDREITPLQAHSIVRIVGDRGGWGIGMGTAEELKPVFRAVYRSVRRALDVAAPEAKDVNDRLMNLYAAKSDLESLTDTAVHFTACS
jgi:hypothetical protein